MTHPKWLAWAQRLQAIGQTGLTYCKDQFDQERYTEVQEIAAEIMASGAGLPDPLPLLDLFRHQSGYATPKIDVRAAVFRDHELLFVRERDDGLWSLPGGWADVGDAPSHAAIREVREESGYQVETIKLAAVFDRHGHGHPPIPFHAYKLFFLCRPTGGEAAHSIETDGVAFFAADRLPQLSLTRVTPSQIHRMFEHHRHPEWPTAFD